MSNLALSDSLTNHEFGDGLRYINGNFKPIYGSCGFNELLIRSACINTESNLDLIDVLRWKTSK